MASGSSGLLAWSRAREARPRETDVVRSLERGLAVIAALGRPGSGRTASELSEDLGLDRAATYRVLATLSKLGYVQGSGGRFALTPRVLELGYRQWSGLNLSEIAQPHLERLVDQTAEACSASILDDDAIVSVARAIPARLVCAAAEVGTRLPAHATAQGRVLLSALTPDQLSAHLAAVELRPLTRATITTRKALRRELEAVRRRGWALVDQELEPGLRSIAVPIADGQRVVAAAGVVTDAHCVSAIELRRTTLPLLRACAGHIESDLALGVSRLQALRSRAAPRIGRASSLGPRLYLRDVRRLGPVA